MTDGVHGISIQERKFHNHSHAEQWMQGTMQRNWDAYDIEHRIKDIRTGSFATNDTTVRFAVSYSASDRWAMLYADWTGRLAFITHERNATAKIHLLTDIPFVATSIEETAVYLRVGNYVRGYILWFSQDVQSIPIYVS